MRTNFIPKELVWALPSGISILLLNQTTPNSVTAVRILYQAENWGFIRSQLSTRMGKLGQS